MPDKFAEKIILQLKKELKSKYPDFRGIYFFGSRARGDYHKDSDYDIAVVFDREIDWKFEDEIIKLILSYEIEYEILIDSHIYQYQDISKPVTPLRENINNEGYYYAA